MALSETKIFRVCEVVDVTDPTGGGRIKVRVWSDDQDSPVEEIHYAFPLLPMMMNVKPKLHEAVLVATAVAEKGGTQRYYIGPVISQPNHMYNEPMDDALQMYETSANVQDPNPKSDSKTFGAYPKDEDIALVGRKNSDIILGENDLRIRCGAKKVTDLDRGTCVFNSDSPAYIKLKYHEVPLSNSEGTGKTKNIESTATIVADRINLIGNKSDYQPCNRKDTNEFIDDDNMKDLIEKAYRLPYGEILVDFLSKFRMAFMTHKHPYPMMPPTIDPNIMAPLQSYNIHQMLSDSVRIN